MPYMLEGKCVYKKNSDDSKGESMGCSESVEMAKKHLAALYAAENKSFAELSMTITKASIPDKKNRTMRLSLVSSDTSEDSYGERMSVELFQDFVERIENNEPVPEPFDDVVCEEEWCGGLPYLSISHYRSGGGQNVPGEVEKVYVDGDKLKAHVILYDTPLGREVWKSVCKDIEERSKPIEERTHKNPVRISIGFLDLEHKHIIDDEDVYIFTRTNLQEHCPKCEYGIKDKMYCKGQLVHKAFTRVPANENTSVEVLRMADEEITTKKDDAKSIIGDLADGLVGKSTVTSEVLVVKAEESHDQEAPVAEVIVPEPAPAVEVKMEHGMEDCPDNDEDCKKKMAAKKEKSKVEGTVEKLLATVTAVKSKTATKAQLQPILDELVNTINEETKDPQDAMMEQMRSIFREELDAKINALRPELVAEVLKAIPAAPVAQKGLEIPVPRSLQVNRSAAAAVPERKLSQIEMIALRSTQPR